MRTWFAFLTTDDSQAKLTVVRDLEPLEFHCLDEFSLDGTANAVLLTGSGICDALGENPIIGLCVSADDCVVGDHSCGPHGTCVDGVNSYSCSCKPGIPGDGHRRRRGVRDH